MKNVRVKVTENCGGRLWWYGIYDGRKELLTTPSKFWERKFAAIRNAKAMARCIGIKYDPEIIKLHDC